MFILTFVGLVAPAAGAGDPLIITSLSNQSFDRLTLSGCTKPSGASHHITSLQTLTSDNRRMITTSLSFATHVFLLLLVVLVVGWPIITVVIQLATPVRPKMMAVLL